MDMYNLLRLTASNPLKFLTATPAPGGRIVPTRRENAERNTESGKPFFRFFHRAAAAFLARA